MRWRERVGDRGRERGGERERKPIFKFAVVSKVVMRVTNVYLSALGH